jgi:hypothetical protein
MKDEKFILCSSSNKKYKPGANSGDKKLSAEYMLVLEQVN